MGGDIFRRTALIFSEAPGEERVKHSLFLVILILLTANNLFSQTSITTRMDWSSGLFQISASRLLTNPSTPDSHPKALKILEQELWPLVEIEMASLTWNSNGSIATLIEQQPRYRMSLEQLVVALHREWSRLSTDRKSIQAEYSINLNTDIMDAFPQTVKMKSAEKPTGW
ncbi:MAG: hypothetical protein B0D92_00335, partial [Spirochaeta sp. LUC14_002_19_P3]